MSRVEASAGWDDRGTAGIARGSSVDAGDTSSRLLLSTLRAGPRLRRMAWVLVIFSVAIFVAILPFTAYPLARIDAFIPSYQSALIVSDAITAVLLFGQFGILRTRALLVLAAGYLFTAAMALVHMLTFPGLFSAAGLLGAGPDSTAWIYMFWHAGFPALVIAYTFLKNEGRSAPRGERSRARHAILAAVFAVLAAAVAITLLTTADAGTLPQIMTGSQSGPNMPYVIYPVWALAFVALAALWTRKPHTVLDIWLMVAMCAWIFEVALSAVYNGGRFSLGYYSGRLYGLAAAETILVVLLFEISALYARLSRSYRTVASSLEQRTAILAETSERFREVRTRLEAAFNASPAAFIALDLKGIVQLWNPAAERLFGWSAEEAIGRFHPVVPDSERANFEAYFERAAQGEPIVGGRGQRVAKDGRKLEVTFNSAPLRDEAGRLDGVFYVVTDETEKRQTERQLQQAQKMEAVGQLTGGIAHDFNNLLGIAIGNLDLMEEKLEADSEARELAQAAISACLRGAELTRQLLAFSRRQPLYPETIDPVETITAMTRLLGRTLGQHITLRLHVEDGNGRDKLWPVVVDRTQLETALLNLTVNARDAMPRGGELTVELSNAHLDRNYADLNIEVVPGDYVQIAVSDTGTGMTPEVVARVFEPFFTTKETGKGTGLGLSMVYGFIKQSGGHIKIYSEVGQGTTIKLWLPRALDAAESAGARKGLDADKMPHGSETVLVVEDNPDIRKVALRQIGDLGYRTLEAADAKEALAILSNGARIDLLFTDIVMPGGKDGRELARAASELKPGLKVLFTSGFTQAGASSNGIEQLSAPLLSKPYRKQQLAHKLREILDG
jgi:PAS domain S-box-containing protein